MPESGHRLRHPCLQGALERRHVGAGRLLGQPALGLAASAELAQPPRAELGHEVGERVQAAAADPPGLEVEAGTVTLQGVDELGDPRGGGTEDTARTSVALEPSERSAACRSARARVATRPRSALVTTSRSGTSMIPDFRNWSTSPEPGWTTTTHGVGDLGDLGLGLADAHRLDHDDVEGGGQGRRRRHGWRVPGRRGVLRPLSSG